MNLATIGAGRGQAAAAGRDKESLLLRSGLPLSEAEDLLRRRRQQIEPDLATYIESSGTAARRRPRRATVRLRTIACMLTILALGAGIAAPPCGSCWTNSPIILGGSTSLNIFTDRL